MGGYVWTDDSNKVNNVVPINDTPIGSVACPDVSKITTDCLTACANLPGYVQNQSYPCKTAKLENGTLNFYGQENTQVKASSRTNTMWPLKGQIVNADGTSGIVSQGSITVITNPPIITAPPTQAPGTIYTCSDAFDANAKITAQNAQIVQNNITNAANAAAGKAACQASYKYTVDAITAKYNNFGWTFYPAVQANNPDKTYATGWVTDPNGAAGTTERQYCPNLLSGNGDCCYQADSVRKNCKACYDINTCNSGGGCLGIGGGSCTYYKLKQNLYQSDFNTITSNASTALNVCLSQYSYTPVATLPVPDINCCQTFYINGNQVTNGSIIFNNLTNQCTIIENPVTLPPATGTTTAPSTTSPTPAPTTYPPITSPPTTAPTPAPAPVQLTVFESFAKTAGISVDAAKGVIIGIPVILAVIFFIIVSLWYIGAFKVQLSTVDETIAAFGGRRLKGGRRGR